MSQDMGDPEKLDERLSAVYAAKTLGHLERVTRDLPEVTLDAPDRAPTHRMLWPGTAAFHEERRLATPPAQAYAMALSQIVPRMGLQNFHLTDEVEPRRLRFIDHAGMIVTVMFLPAADGGTIVSAFGHANRAVRKAFANLRDESPRPSVVDDFGDVGLADLARLAEEPDRLAVRLGLVLEDVGHVGAAGSVVLQQHPAFLVARLVHHRRDERAADRAWALQHPAALRIPFAPREVASDEIGAHEHGPGVWGEIHDL
jgi:hypothetical protein